MSTLLTSLTRSLLICTLFTGTLSAQTWDFIKEKDGIKIYTRREPNSALKSFMGIMDLKTQMTNVCALVGTVKNTKWWDPNITEIRVLEFEENKHIQYYLVYHAPWPLSDRDLCVDARISDNPLTGERIVYSVPFSGKVPERSDRVRIKNYWQKWTIQPHDDGTIHVVLEGFADPAGNIPGWIYNMVITETPLNVMRGMRNHLNDSQ